jgi:hypothetical protein
VDTGLRTGSLMDPRPGTYHAAVTALPAPPPEWARPDHVLGAPVPITLAGRAVELWPEEG